MADRTVKVTLAAQVNNYVAGLEQARKATEANSKASQDLAKKYAEQNQAMSQIGTSLVAAGAVALAATGIAVKAAIDWETAWAGVTKTVEGTPAQLAEMEVGIRNLAKELPATHEELAAVAEAAGQLGVKREGVLAFTRTMVDLANTTNLSADEASTSIAQLMNVMQTAPDEVDNLGAALVALGNNGASTERDIIQMAQRIAGAGKVVGLTEAEVLGFANALASVGIEAEAGGSAISRIMTDMAMAVSAGGADLENFAKVAGMSGQDFAVAFKDAPAEAIATFVEGLGGINAAGGDVFKTLSDLGQSDIRTSQALLGMANSGDMLRESLDLGSKAWDENTALAAEAEKRYETTASKLQVMSNNVADAAISYGDVFLPAVQGVAEAVGMLATGFGSLPAPVMGAVAVLATLAATVALGGGAFLLAIPKIAEYKIALGVLSTSSIPAVAAATTGLMTATSKTAAGLAATAKFLTGPWGVALAAAGISVKLLSDYIESLKATTVEYQNVIKGADGAGDLFKVADQGRIISQLDRATNSAEDFQYHLDLIANNDFATGFSLPAQQMRKSLQDIGAELAKTAGTDLPAAQRAFALLADETDGSEKQMSALFDAMGGPFADALMAQADALGISTAGMSEAERAAILLEIAQGEGAAASEVAADGYGDVAQMAADLDDQLRSLLETMNEANSVSQDAETQNINYAQALADADTHIKNAQAGVEGYALGLDLASEAGRTNRQMLVDLAADSQAAAQAQHDLDGNTANYKKTLQDGHQAVIDRAKALGATEEEARNLADSIYEIPTEREFEMIARTADAYAMIERFKSMVNSIPGSKMVSVGVQVKAPTGIPDYFGSNTIPQANGSVMDFYANGGMRENHVAQIARGGSWRVWAEPETGGEAYIPLAASKRARSLDIWEETGRRLGVAGFANGGFSPQYASSGSSSTSVSVSPSVSLAGATLRVDMGGQQFTAVIRDQIIAVDQQNARQVRRGRQG